MLHIIISSSILILVLLGLRLLLRGKISLRFQYALWLLVAVRLLIPFNFGHSFLSVENFTPTASVMEEAPIREEGNLSFDPIGHSGRENFDHASTGDFSSAKGSPVTDGSSIFQGGSTAHTEGSSTGASSHGVSSAATDVNSHSAENLHSESSPHLWKKTLTLIWISGGILFAVGIAGSNLVFRRRIGKKAAAVSVEGCTIPVFETEEVFSPCLVGFLRPCIYLRPHMSPEMQAHVLAHEYTHYRHGDHIWSVIRTVCLCVYWFHPLVWLAAYISKQDGELACDEGAIHRLGESRRIDYGRTLLQVIVQANYRSNFLHIATTMGASKAQLKERMILIAKKPKKLILAMIVCLFVVALAVGCCFTGGEKNPDLENPDPKDRVTIPLQVIDAYVDENYRIPQLQGSTDEYSSVPFVNQDIRTLFEDKTPYQSINYSVTRTKTMQQGENKPVLSLLITATTTEGEQLYAAYNLNAETGEALQPDDEKSQQLKGELFAYELLYAFERESDFRYTEDVHALLVRNLSDMRNSDDLRERTVYWFEEDGTIMYSFPYSPLGYVGYECYIQPEELNVEPGYYVGPYQSFPGVNINSNASVVELTDYGNISPTGEVNRFPFLLGIYGNVVQINGEILNRYTRNVQNTTYTFNDYYIVSLAITAEEMGRTISNAYNVDACYQVAVSKSRLFECADMTEEEYLEIAGPIFEDWFFRLFPETDLDLLEDRDVVAMSGSRENVAESVPYFAPDGSIWAVSKIYNVQGSEAGEYLIPITNHEFSPEYLNYLEKKDK